MSQKGGPDPGQSLERTPPSAGIERLCRQGQLTTNFEIDVEFDYEIFCFGIVHVMISTISQPARQVARTPRRTCLPPSSCMWRRPCSPCPCTHGANLTIDACLRVQGASSIYLLSILNGRDQSPSPLVRRAIRTIRLGPRPCAQLTCALPLQARVRRSFDLVT